MPRPSRSAIRCRRAALRPRRHASARASVASSGATAALASHVGAQSPRPRVRRRRLRRARGSMPACTERRPRPARRAPRRARGRSTSRRRADLVDVALRVGHLDLGRCAAPVLDGGSPCASTPFVRVPELDRAGLGRVGLGAQRIERIERRASTATSCDAGARRFGDERLDHPFVGDGGQLAFEPAAPFGDEVREARGSARATPRCGRADRRRRRRPARRARARPPSTASSSARRRTRTSCSSRAELAARVGAPLLARSAAVRSRGPRGAA